MSRVDLLSTPSRIAFAGDWHGDLQWACNAVFEADRAGANVILHAGDFGYMFRPHFLTHLNEALTVAGMRLLFVDGNHEDFPWLHRQRIGKDGLRALTDRIAHLPRGFRWRWGGVRFLALGGAHSVDGMFRRQGGLMWHKEERITDEQAANVMNGGHADVLLAHDCPDGVTIPGLHPEDFPVLEIMRSLEHRQLLLNVVRVVRPRWIWHGHYHVRYEQTVDLGYGPVKVTGLSAHQHGIVGGNLQIVDLQDLSALAARKDAPCPT